MGTCRADEDPKKVEARQAEFEKHGLTGNNESAYQSPATATVFDLSIFFFVSLAGAHTPLRFTPITNPQHSASPACGVLVCTCLLLRAKG